MLLKRKQQELKDREYDSDDEPLPRGPKKFTTNEEFSVGREIKVISDEAGVRFKEPSERSHYSEE